VELGKPSIKIEFDDFANKKNQTFVSYLSKYLTNSNIRKTLIKINPYTIKYGSFARSNNYGTESVFYVTLSLLELSEYGDESWECSIYECDDVSENEVKSTTFDNGQIAIEYFLSQIGNLSNN
jgi:hypothetical protein